MSSLHLFTTKCFFFSFLIFSEATTSSSEEPKSTIPSMHAYPVIAIQKLTNDEVVAAAHRGKHLIVPAMPVNTGDTEKSMDFSSDSEPLMEIPETSAATSSKSASSIVSVNGKFMCSEIGCNYSCLTEKTIRQHLLRDHGIGNAIICLCGFIFIRWEQYQSHLKLIKKDTVAKKLKNLVKKLKIENNCSKYQWKHDQYVSAPKPADTEFVKTFASRYEAYMTQNFKILCKVQEDLF